MTITVPADKIREAEQIATQVREYLENGGLIEVLETREPHQGSLRAHEYLHDDW